MESNGPETKVRGPASHIHERYLQLARDAASSGDRVLSENYLQHADHYFRLWRSMQPATPPQQQTNDRFEENTEAEGEEDNAEAEVSEDAEASADGEQPDVDFPQGQQQQFDRGGDGRRRRGRRSRYRSGDGDGDGEGSAREDRPARAEGGEREERPARSEGAERRERRPSRDDSDSGPEGFSNGPKPAFLRD